MTRKRTSIDVTDLDPKTALLQRRTSETSNGKAAEKLYSEKLVEPFENELDEVQRHDSIEKARDFGTKVEKAIADWRKAGCNIDAKDCRPLGNFSSIAEYVTHDRKNGFLWELWRLDLPERNRPAHARDLLSMTLIELLNCYEPDTRARLATLLLANYTKKLTRNQVTSLKRLSQSVTSPYADTSLNHYVQTGSTGKIESVEDGVAKGELSQAHYYQSLDCANAWVRLTGAGSYSSFLHCKDGLERLIEHPKWITLLQQSSFRTVIMLGGGGAVAKDKILLEHFTESLDSIFTYLLVDLSDPLLRSSIVALIGWRYLEDRVHDFHIGTMQHNILELDNAEDHRLGLDDDLNAIWFLTAGTIGNLDEKLFRGSIIAKARSGDLLVIGAHTYDPDQPEEETQASIEGSYDSDEMNSFFYTPVAEVLKALKINKLSPAKVVKTLRPHIAEDGQQQISKIRRTRTARWVFNHKEHSVGLLKSSRYHPDEFRQFFHSVRLKHVLTVDSIDPTFKQFVFRRT